MTPSQKERIFLYKSSYYISKIYLSIFRKIGTNTTSQNTALIIPPTDSGSLGDDAMVVAAARHLLKGKHTVHILSKGNDWENRLLPYRTNCLFIKSWKGFENYLSYFFYAIEINKIRPKIIYLIGADVIDGYYSIHRSEVRLNLLKLSSIQCDDVRLISFSFNDSPEDRIVKSIKSLPQKVKLFCRDSASSRRLNAFGIKNTKTSDLAFLLEAKCKNKILEIQEILKYAKLQGKMVIAININAIHITKFGDEFIYKISKLADHLITEKNAYILFVSHDDRYFGELSDSSCIKLCIAKMKTHLSNNYLVLNNAYYSAENLKHIVGYCDAVITGRMHFAILSISQGTPAAMFSYQGKQSGIITDFNIDVRKALIEPDHKSDEIINKIDSFLNYSNDYKNKIESNLHSVILSAQKNLE